ncbi:hypothetical protein ABIB25_000092 [Nakamurella sp. UYEF19]
MTMVWIDRDPSVAYQAAKVTASATANTSVAIGRVTPKLSVRLSVIKVPTTLISTTASQYTPGTYLFNRNCTTSTRPATT